MEYDEKFYSFVSVLTEDEFKEFIHSCTNEICGRKGPSYLNLRSRDQFSLEDFKEAVGRTKRIVLECMAFDLDSEKAKQCIPNLNHEKYEVLHACLLVRKNELEPFAIINQANASDNFLTDYDWKLKWVVGSSSFSDINEPLLNLDLHMKSANEKKTLNLELDKAELKLLIEAVERAQQNMLNR